MYMVSNEEIKKMTGQASGDKKEFYKLDEVSMSGNDGSFTLRGLAQEKGEDGKYPSKLLGKELSIVILKTRWRYFKYNELPDGSADIKSSTEYDNKKTDRVTIFPSKETGIAFEMKEKYGLSTQQVVYAFLPSESKIVRFIVKSSGLTGDKNPNKELGLFEYKNLLDSTDSLYHEFVTLCKGVERKDPKGNSRKDYIALSFLQGRACTDTEKAKMVDLIKEVHAKTHGKSLDVAEEYENQAVDEINPDDIPF